ncbi:MAG: potassium transporter Kup [Sphingobacteriales bacterium]|nr:MAG: potassium transporter Kup [Sphingobacteriales bacterium]
MEKQHGLNKLTLAGLLVTLGIIYGDIGTSPLYVMQAILGDRPVSQLLVYGGLSCVFWTLTIQTTVKYIILTLRADNKGEGGIFSLYALVRKRGKWLVYPAIIGGAALLADGVITPSITVSSSIEGLRLYYEDINTVPIVIAILCGLFIFQRMGTMLVGSSFGPIMFIWFSMLGVLGLGNLGNHWEILHAINPKYAIEMLVEYPKGFWLLGAVFLCTTGAEALYSDLGHCGRKNIRISWIFVKTCLLLNYFGQGAWIMQHTGEVLSAQNPFYATMPDWFLLIGIIIATMASVIASQALITGSFTLINEAMRLNLWPKVRVLHPTALRGQIYVPSINIMLFIGCVAMVLGFRESKNMEAAYGLSISITMLMTTLLYCTYLYVKRGSYFLVGLTAFVFLSIELCFLAANLNKFMHGGYVTVFIGSVLFAVMFVWFKARKIKNRYLEFVNVKDFLPLLKALSDDVTVPKYCSHLIYLTSADYPSQMESKIFYSVFQKQPKRADVYWFVHVDVVDEPYTLEYVVTPLIPGDVFRVDFMLGFRVPPRINLYFKKVVENMVANNEVDTVSRYESLNKQNVSGDFRFVVIEKFLSFENELPFIEKLIMDGYFFLKSVSLKEGREFGLDTSSVTIEKFPLILIPPKEVSMKRVYE